MHFLAWAHDFISDLHPWVDHKCAIILNDSLMPDDRLTWRSVSIPQCIILEIPDTLSQWQHIWFWLSISRNFSEKLQFGNVVNMPYSFLKLYSNCENCNKSIPWCKFFIFTWSPLVQSLVGWVEDGILKRASSWSYSPELSLWAADHKTILSYFPLVLLWGLYRR